MFCVLERGTAPHPSFLLPHPSFLLHRREGKSSPENLIGTRISHQRTARRRISKRQHPMREHRVSWESHRTYAGPNATGTEPNIAIAEPHRTAPNARRRRVLPVSRNDDTQPRSWVRGNHSLPELTLPDVTAPDLTEPKSVLPKRVLQDDRDRRAAFRINELDFSPFRLGVPRIPPAPVDPLLLRLPLVVERCEVSWAV